MDFASIKIGTHLVIKDRVCKAIYVMDPKTGKHGFPRRVVTGIDVITDKKYVEMFEYNSLFPRFDIKIVTFQYIYTDYNDRMVLLTDENEENTNYIVSEEFRDKLVEGCSVTILIVTVNNKEEYRVTNVSC